MKPPNDLDQVYRLSLSGDAPGVEKLLHACYPPVYHLALSILNDSHDAEDAAQEALLSAVTSLDRYRGDSSFKTWLYAITINACRAALRKRRAQQVLAVFLPMTATPPTPEEAASRSEIDCRLWRAIDSLDEKHRLPIILRYAYDLSSTEIAETLGISEGTVYSRLHYAREKLQHILTRDEASGRTRVEAQR